MQFCQTNYTHNIKSKGKQGNDWMNCIAKVIFIGKKGIP